MSTSRTLPADTAAIEESILDAWSAGKNTLEIAREVLGAPVHCAGLEARVSRVIAAEQDRRYAERQAAITAEAAHA